MQKQIDEKIRNNSKLKKVIEVIRKKVDKQSESEDKSAGEEKSDEKKTKPSAFAVSTYSALPTSNYQLRNNYILDSKTTIHICNDRTKFRNFTPTSEDDFLYTGDSVIPIKSLKTISITVQTPNGPFKVNLLKTAFIPSFHTNIMSLDRFIAKHIH